MLLQVDHLNKAFSGHTVLDDLSFGLDSGEVLGLTGHNGAGKTTLLRVIAGIMPPDSGQVFFDGHSMTSADLRQVGYLPEERGLYRRQRAGDQALFMARLKGLGRKEAEAAARQWFSHLGIADWYERPVAQLSKGMQQKLQFLVTVVHKPRLLILDEPFSGFDSDNAAMLCREINRLRDTGTAVILATHNHEASQLFTKTITL